MCKLCLTEKPLIINHINDNNISNKKSELINTCRHLNKFSLGTRKTSTRKIPTRMIYPGQFPSRKPPPKKVSTQDNSHFENSHPG